MRVLDSVLSSKKFSLFKELILGSSLLSARIATTKAKPAGVYALGPEELSTTVADMRLISLPGVGYGLIEKLHDALTPVIESEDDIDEVAEMTCTQFLGIIKQNSQVF